VITPTPLPQGRARLLATSIVQALDLSVQDTTYQQGYNVLRWFLKGWIQHPDPAQQADLSLFAFAYDFEGRIVPEASAKGYLILRAALAGHLVPSAAVLDALTPTPSDGG
jgi:hypothetical protein